MDMLSSDGPVARDNFLRDLRRHGGPIVVIRNLHQKNEVRMRIERALYQRARGATEFQFDEARDLLKGDHIQQIGSRVLYCVRECVRHAIAGFAIYYIATVSQVADSTGRVTRG